MQNTLFYCMTNTQLRRIAYACGKSQKYKNKAAAILRFRSKTKQLQAGVDGFQITYTYHRNHFFNFLYPRYSKKNKGNLKLEKQYYYKRTFNFSNLKQETAGSLHLQGRSQLLQEYQIRESRTNYKLGKRRINSQPRKRFEELEEVLSSTQQELPAVRDIHTVESRNPLAKAAEPTRHEIVPSVGLKPICAPIQIIGRVKDIIGLTRKISMPLKICLIYIIVFLVLRFLKPKMLVHYIACTIIVLIFYFIYIMIRMLLRCNAWCFKTVVAYEAYQHGQQINGVRYISQNGIRCIENQNTISFWND